MQETNLKQQAKKAAIWSFSANLAKQGIQFIIGLVLARLLSPSDYGIVALPMILLSLAQCFIDSGFSSALIQKPDLTEKDLSTAFYFNIIVGVSCYILLFLTSPLIADFYNAPILADVLKVTALSTIFNPLQSVHGAVFRKNLDFRTTSLISIASKITTGVVGLTLAFLGCGIWALVFQGVAGQVMSLCLIWYKSKWRPTTGWSNESFKYLYGIGSKDLLSCILDTLHHNINPIIIGKFYGHADLGIYNRARNYCALPQQQISGTLNSVTFPILCKIQNDEERLNSYFRKLLRIVIFILAPAELLLAALARPLILITISAKWEPCIFLLQLMCFAVMLWPVQSLNMSLFRAKGRTDLILKSNVIIKLLSLAVKVVTLPLGLVAICIGSIVHAVLAISWVAYYAGKFSDYGITKQFLEISKPIALSIAMFIVVLLTTQLFESMLLQIIVGAIVGFIFYIGMAYLLKLFELQEVIYLIRHKRIK